MNSLCYRTQNKETESVILTSPKLIALKRALSVINVWPLMWAKIFKSWGKHSRINEKTKRKLLL